MNKYERNDQIKYGINESTTIFVHGKLKFPLDTLLRKWQTQINNSQFKSAIDTIDDLYLKLQQCTQKMSIDCFHKDCLAFLMSDENLANFL